LNAVGKFLKIISSNWGRKEQEGKRKFKYGASKCHLTFTRNKKEEKALGVGGKSFPDRADDGQERGLRGVC
jgi:hypothetical protein